MTVCPGRWPMAPELAVVASGSRHIRNSMLRAAQSPDRLPGTAITGPLGWQENSAASCFRREQGRVNLRIHPVRPALQQRRSNPDIIPSKYARMLGRIRMRSRDNQDDRAPHPLCLAR